MEKKLYRSRTDRKLLGVCGGLGEYFSFDPTIFRLIAAICAIASCGTVALVYLVSALVIPEQP